MIENVCLFDLPITLFSIVIVFNDITVGIIEIFLFVVFYIKPHIFHIFFLYFISLNRVLINIFIFIVLALNPKIAELIEFNVIVTDRNYA